MTKSMRGSNDKQGLWRLWEREFAAMATIEQLYELLEVGIMAPLDRGAIPANGTAPQDGTANDTVNGTAPQDGTANGTTGERVLRLLAENPSLSYGRIAERLAVSRRSVARALKALRERQSIVRDGSDKTASGLLRKTVIGMATLGLKYSSDWRHQVEAIEAITDSFRGQELLKSEFTADAGCSGQLGFESLTVGHANGLRLFAKQLLENLHGIQEENSLPATAVPEEERLGQLLVPRPRREADLGPPAPHRHRVGLSSAPGPIIRGVRDNDEPRADGRYAGSTLWNNSRFCLVPIKCKLRLPHKGDVVLASFFEHLLVVSAMCSGVRERMNLTFR